MGKVQEKDVVKAKAEEEKRASLQAEEMGKAKKLRGKQDQALKDFNNNAEVQVAPSPPKAYLSRQLRNTRRESGAENLMSDLAEVAHPSEDYPLGPSAPSTPTPSFARSLLDTFSSFTNNKNTKETGDDNDNNNKNNHNNGKKSSENFFGGTTKQHTTGKDGNNTKPSAPFRGVMSMCRRRSFNVSLLLVLLLGFQLLFFSGFRAERVVVRIPVYTSSIMSSILPAHFNNNKINKKVSSFPSSSTMEPFPQLPSLIENVFVTDIILVPNEHRFIVIALNPISFKMKENSRGDKAFRNVTQVFNRTFYSEYLVHPVEIDWWVDDKVPVECLRISTSSGDSNVDDALDMLSCNLPSYQKPESEWLVGVEDRPIAKLSASHLNTLHSYEFHRPPPPKTFGGGVAVCIKSFRQFSPFVLDIIRYYYEQGFSHVYLGVSLQEVPSLLSDLKKLLSDYKDFVSFGTINSSHVSFRGGGHQKMPFINSALYHSKSFDRLLMVNDIDEVVVSMNPNMTASKALLAGVPEGSQNCYVGLYTHILPGHTRNSTFNLSLAKTFPTRCDGGLRNYTKAVAVLGNAQFGGLHVHDANCPRGEFMSRSFVTIHHYVSFWYPRLKADPGCNIPSEFARVSSL